MGKLEKDKEKKRNELIEEATENAINENKSIQDSLEYLMNGAILTCNKATTDVKVINGQPVGYKTSKKISDRKKTILMVYNNPMDSNGERMATVKDKKIFTNIRPFECNCVIEPNEAEIQEIVDDIEICKSYGICRKLMRLEDDWENAIRDVKYETYTHIDEEGQESEAVGVTMQAMLFCNHGGIITAINSGNYAIERELKDTQMVKEYMWEFFRNAGFSEYAVAGILGNVYAETGGTFNPETMRGTNYYGLFQIGGERKDALVQRGREWAEAMGWPEDEWNEGWKNVQVQCEYVLEEYYFDSQNGWGNNKIMYGGSEFVATKTVFETAKSTTETALAWGAGYERCITNKNAAGVYEGIQGQDVRIEQAQMIYDEFTQNE